MQSLSDQKVALRGKLRLALATLSPEQRSRAAAAACAGLRCSRAWQEAHSVLLFAPLPSELNLWPCVIRAFAEGKAVGLPRFDPVMNGYTVARVLNLERDIVPGRYGIREPAPHCELLTLNRLDLILVPGLAFDRWGHRLGRGKGHYDRWLEHHHGLKCGVAFDEQVLDAIPVEPHDLTVDCLLTPSRWIEVSPRRPVLD